MVLRFDVRRPPSPFPASRFDDAHVAPLRTFSAATFSSSAICLVWWKILWNMVNNFYIKSTNRRQLLLLGPRGATRVSTDRCSCLCSFGRKGRLEPPSPRALCGWSRAPHLDAVRLKWGGTNRDQRVRRQSAMTRDQSAMTRDQLDTRALMRVRRKMRHHRQACFTLNASRGLSVSA